MLKKYGVKMWEIVLLCVIIGVLSAMTGFLGEYEVAIDAKGRFLVPAGFRKQLAEGAAERFVINRGLDKHLTLYTMESWEAFSGIILTLNDFNPEESLLKRLILNGATIVEPDSAGRLLLPKTLMEYVGLKKDMVFSCNGDKVELWDKDTYYAHMQENMGQLAYLAQKILGNRSLHPSTRPND